MRFPCRLATLGAPSDESILREKTLGAPAGQLSGFDEEDEHCWVLLVEHGPACHQSLDGEEHSEQPREDVEMVFWAEGVEVGAKVVVVADRQKKWYAE